MSSPAVAEMTSACDAHPGPHVRIADANALWQHDQQAVEHRWKLLWMARHVVRRRRWWQLAGCATTSAWTRHADVQWNFRAIQQGESVGTWRCTSAHSGGCAIALSAPCRVCHPLPTSCVQTDVPYSLSSRSRSSSASPLSKPIAEQPNATLRKVVIPSGSANQNTSKRWSM